MQPLVLLDSKNCSKEILSSRSSPFHFPAFPCMSFYCQLAATKHHSHYLFYCFDHLEPTTNSQNPAAIEMKRTDTSNQQLHKLQRMFLPDTKIWRKAPVQLDFWINCPTKVYLLSRQTIVSALLLLLLILPLKPLGVFSRNLKST